jgi:DNA-binding Lrp family transcriptional regulator
MSGELDRIDSRILVELQNNARLSNKELAARVGLAPSSCLERVRRLETSGALRGYHAEVDPGVLGIGLEALISVKLHQHSRDLVEAFRGDILDDPEVIEVYHLAGTTDFLIHVMVRDPEHLRNLAMDRISSRPEVAHLETALVFEHLKGKVLPDFTRGERAGARRG